MNENIKVSINYRPDETDTPPGLCTFTFSYKIAEQMNDFLKNYCDFEMEILKGEKIDLGWGYEYRFQVPEEKQEHVRECLMAFIQAMTVDQPDRLN